MWAYGVRYVHLPLYWRCMVNGSLKKCCGVSKVFDHFKNFLISKKIVYKLRMSTHDDIMEKVLKEILEKNFMAAHNLTSEIPSMLQYVPDQYKTLNMCSKAVESNPESLEYVPSQYKRREMCLKAVESNPELLQYVPDRHKTVEMCSNAVLKNPELLQYVPNRLKKNE